LQNLDLNQIQLRNVQLTELTEVVRSDSFYKSLDELGDNLSESFSDMDVRSQLGVASVVGVVLSASASIFGQLLRAGSLLASFLSVVPLWRQFDPLPILVATDEEKKKKRIRFLGGKKDEDEDKEEDEVEELFDHDQEKGDRR